MEPDVSQILIVASDLDLKHKITQHYAARSFHVTATNDPLHALDFLTNAVVNLVLFQYHPNEPTLTALLQDMLEKCAEVPLIVLTQIDAAENITNMLRLGVTDVFNLPLDSMPELDQSVLRHVKRSALFYENLQYRQELETVYRQVNKNLAELQQDQIAGRLIQQRMMPPEECSINGLSMHRYMKSSLYLSGDFIDHIRLDEDCVLFYLADVSGHGASSAFLSVLLKNITNRLTREFLESDANNVISPAAVVAQINSELLDFDIDKHMTVFMGMLDRNSHILTYCVGGHLPMPLLSQNDEVQYLPGLGSGLPVGLFDDAEYTDLTQQLEPEFKLLLSSDGIFEILPCDQIADKEEQLRKILQQSNSRLEGLVDALNINDIDAVPDDIALLSICGEAHA
ncbi:SpoIIE family protein phosphatase [Candidatus Njordibacter sp. Uisw_039]|jgi:sigma-B regulation protein RsbU (phosphoserine phosphatase)|uniref:PP2C family protein-serine/threonine phosphatase n=1 Tax=Candidatus Njordibacter sp. Uisw_039 TaxID=3230972 RepID=UPI003A23ED06|tara:strand:- start:906 stop:2099 length:1194 start_codon:yes stop_codon:yes gene_type:complete